MFIRQSVATRDLKREYRAKLRVSERRTELVLVMPSESKFAEGKEQR